MAIARVQKAVAASTTVSWPSTTTAGNLLIAMVSCDGNNSTCTISGWTQADVAHNGTDGNVFIFYIENASARSGAVTPTFGGNTESTIWIAEYSGVVTASSLDKSTHNAGGTSTSPDSGTTAATTVAIEVCLALVTNGNGKTMTSPSAGWTIVDNTLATSYKTAFGENITSSTGAQDFSGTYATSGSWCGAIATFKGVIAASNENDMLFMDVM